MTVVDLSVDFDFFVRMPIPEKLGEADHARSASLWRRRAKEYNVVTECDIEKHADLAPEDLRRELERRNCVFGPGKTMSKDSHKHAHEFFACMWKMDGEPDALVNIDQHHDCWSIAEKENYLAGVLDCSNWVRHFLVTAPRVRVVQVYPQFISGYRNDWPRHPQWRAIWWDQILIGVPPELVIRHIFLSRSSPWTPPHLKPRFDRMVESFINPL